MNSKLPPSMLVKLAYATYTNHNVQTMLPTSPRRELTPDELMQIEQGKSQWIPKIFDTLGDSPAVNLASPGKQSLLWGVGVGAPAALIGAAQSGSAMAGLGAGAGIGGIMALLAYLGRRKANEDTIETMRRLPEGANIRDFEADPLITERRRLMQEYALRAATHR